MNLKTFYRHMKGKKHVDSVINTSSRHSKSCAPTLTLNFAHEPILLTLSVYKQKYPFRSPDKVSQALIRRY